MIKYHKIQTVFKRDPETNMKTLLHGDFSLPEFKYLNNNEWTFTEKIDGCSIRTMFDGNNITFGGKTDNAQIPVQLLNRLTALFLPLKNKFIDMFQPNTEGNSVQAQTPVQVCLYGEGYGAKIQSGGKYRKDQGFVLFDMRLNNWWLKRKDIVDIAAQLGIDVVPVVGKGTLTDMVNMAKKGFNSQWGDFLAEGIVARPVVELKARNGDRIITKIKYKDFEMELR